MKKWTDRNLGSIILEVTDGQITELDVVGGIDAMLASTSVLIKTMSVEFKVDTKKIIDCINYTLENTKVK